MVESSRHCDCLIVGRSTLDENAKEKERGRWVVLTIDKTKPTQKQNNNNNHHHHHQNITTTEITLILKQMMLCLELDSVECVECVECRVSSHSECLRTTVFVYRIAFYECQ